LATRLFPARDKVVSDQGWVRAWLLRRGGAPLLQIKGFRDKALEAQHFGHLYALKHSQNGSEMIFLLLTLVGGEAGVGVGQGRVGYKGIGPGALAWHMAKLLN